MNLSPTWVPVLKDAGFEAIHWSSVGKADDVDKVIMDWASQHGWLVFTHDLDFGTLLALSQAGRPSVFQARTQDVSPDGLSAQVTDPGR